MKSSWHYTERRKTGVLWAGAGAAVVAACAALWPFANELGREVLVVVAASGGVWAVIVGAAFLLSSLFYVRTEGAPIRRFCVGFQWWGGPALLTRLWRSKIRLGWRKGTGVYFLRYA